MNVRTDERTNGRKLARLCLPAKAGATKRLLLKKIYILIPIPNIVWFSKNGGEDIETSKTSQSG